MSKEEKQLLKDESIYPTDEVLKECLGNIYPIYASFISTITNDDFDLTPEWKYYKDGKAWLCKVVYKKKTIFWLSIWEGYFKIGFYFTEKTGKGIVDLDIDNQLIENFYNGKAIGKLKPLILDISSGEQISDLLTLVSYKKKIK